MQAKVQSKDVCQPAVHSTAMDNGSKKKKNGDET